MPHGCSVDEGEGEWRTEAAAAALAAGSRVPCRVSAAKGKRGGGMLEATLEQLERVCVHVCVNEEHT